MTSKLALIILLLVTIPVLMIVVALIQNDLPWNTAPGAGKRLATYLNSNVAETTIDSGFPELKPRRYALESEVLKKLILEAIDTLKWETTEAFDQDQVLQAVVSTPLFGFKDDITIKVEPGAGDTVIVSMRSASRTGKGDLGTNTRHILDLFETLDNVVANSAQR